MIQSFKRKKIVTIACILGYRKGRLKKHITNIFGKP